MFLIPRCKSVSRIQTAFCSYQERTKESGSSFTEHPNASASATATWIAPYASLHCPISISRGSPPISPRGAVINANLANQNELKVGDTIELSTENGTKVSVQIIGIFMSAGNAEKDQPSETTAVNRIENQIFIDNSTYKELFKEAEFEKICIYSKRPEKLDVLETSLQKIFGNDVELSTSDTLYQQMSAPLEQISKVANLMLVLTLVTGTVVVSLLLCMWMRTRQKEVAIFMSLGKTKSEIFLQTLLEAGSVFTLSVLGATAIGKLFSGVLQNVITGSETVTENLKVVLQIQDIGMLFLLGGAVILVALCCSILPILRANPKDILAKMEG